MGEDGAKMYEWLDRVGYAADRAALRREFPDVAFHDFESWARNQDWTALLQDGETVVKIGVSGASGHLRAEPSSSELVQRTRGYEIVAITRTPEAVAGQARARFGDYNRPETLVEAYAGLDRLLVIPTLEPVGRAKQNMTAIDGRRSRLQVKHVVFMSTAHGARREEEPALSASYWRGEQHLVAKASAWTILRMNYYAEGFVQQAQASLAQGVLTGLAENRVAFVARDDVAAAALGILIGNGHDGAIYNATGPGATIGRGTRGPYRRDHWSTACVLRVITEEHLGCAGTRRAGLLPAAVINVVTSIQASFAAGAFDVVTGDVERLGGRPPKPAPRRACRRAEIVSMNEILGIGRLKIRDGKLDEFKRLASQFMHVVRTKDTGTLQYELYFNSDQTECIVLERYRDVPALLDHQKNLGGLMAALVETCAVSSDALGTATPELIEVLEGSPVRLFTPYQSL